MKNNRIYYHKACEPFKVLLIKYNSRNKNCKYKDLRNNKIRWVSKKVFTSVFKYDIKENSPLYRILNETESYS